jgi:hypothetical protein
MKRSHIAPRPCDSRLLDFDGDGMLQTVIQTLVLGMLCTTSCIVSKEVYGTQGLPEAEVFAGAQQDPRSVIVNGGEVFWTSGLEVRKASVLGGTPVTVATSDAVITALAVDRQYVYWTTEAPGGVQQAARSGGPAVSLLAQATIVFSPVVENDMVYVLASQDGVHFSIQALSSQTQIQIVSGIFKPGGLTANGTFLVWTDSGPSPSADPAQSRVMKCSLADCSPTELLTLSSMPRAIRVHGEHLYYDGLKRVSLNGGKEEIISSGASGFLELDGIAAVWATVSPEGETTSSSAGVISQYVWADGRVTRPSAPLQGAPTSLAIEANCYFWGDAKQHAVMRMKRWSGGVPEN